MEIVWVVNAKNSLEETLDYWDEHNGTTSYSNKIISELKKLLSQIKDNPYSQKYEKDLGIYVGTILKRRFLIYYAILEDKNNDFKIISSGGIILLKGKPNEFENIFDNW